MTFTSVADSSICRWINPIRLQCLTLCGLNCDKLGKHASLFVAAVLTRSLANQQTEGGQKSSPSAETQKREEKC